ncbi:MAG TPA: phospholipase D family protein [Casimicrobiaceae bacterium]|jgi:putative cardiolipin synthase
MTTGFTFAPTNRIVRSAAVVQSLFAVLVIVLAACTTLPPGSDYPKTPSTAFAQPSTTRLGKQLAKESVRHSGQSGFRILPYGVEGLLLRTQLVRAAERTLDIQYYIFAEDDTGKLLQQSVLDAADRGVRIRLLIDDQNSFQRHEAPEIISALNDHANIELRLFNPFVYRGQFPLLRYLDMAVNAQRINHRMHNKLLVADNAIAIVGGRNVGDEYFDAGTPPVRFGDFDVAVVGPAVPQLSASFDEFWNNSLSIPQKAVAPVAPLAASLPEARAELATHRAGINAPEIEQRLNKGDPLNGLLDGRLSFVWANAAVIADHPEKAEVPPGEPVRSPVVRQLVQEMRNVNSEVAIVTPYFVPGERAMARIKELRQRNVRVRVLTNSLSSTDFPIVHSAYRRYRTPLLEAGVELSEIRAASDGAPMGSSPQGSGASGKSGDAPFALHAKLYVFDRQRVFIGSANFDRRSFKLNTELGLMIESRELAGQIVAQFEQFAASPNSYRLILEPGGPKGERIRWRTQLDGKSVDLDDDPDTTAWRRFEVAMYSMLPIDELL